MLELGQSQTLRQTQTLSAEAQQSLRLLAMSSMDLRAELIREMSLNPAMDDFNDSREVSLDAMVKDESSRRDDYDVEDIDNFSGSTLDCFSFENARMVTPVDSDAQERRDHFFDSQVAHESLQDHLLAQVSLSPLQPADAALAGTLIGHIDEDGYFRDSFKDLVMVTGRSEADMRHVLSVISSFDPEGCGSLDLRECFLSQLDKLNGSHLENEMRIVIDRHLNDLAEGKHDAIYADTGLSAEDLPDVISLLRSLDAAPGRAFESHREEFVNPEVHIFLKKDGSLGVRVDARDIPDIHPSKRFLALAANPHLSPEEKSFVREKLKAVEALQEAVVNRESTIAKVALEVANAQYDWITGKSNDLKPLTRRDIAEKVGFHEATVSRTVQNKWMTSPRGTLQMSALFSAAIRNASGELVSNKSAQQCLKALIAAEDKSHPLSDAALVPLMAAKGFPIKIRTVSKYRAEMNIPSSSARKTGGKKIEIG